ncbi:MAG: GNAT family N-acetyltransferase [Candidatus Eisenbacteria bacterium]
MSELVAHGLRERPAEVAGVAATAAGRSFATGEAFERAFEAHGPRWEPRPFTVRGGDRLLAVLPGRLERRFGGAWYRAQPFGAPAGPLFDPALAAEGPARLAPVAAALWRALGDTARAEGWLGGDVTLAGAAALPGGEALLPPPDMGTLRHDEAHVIDLAAGPAAWRASLDNAARRMLGQGEKRGVVIAPGEAADLPVVFGLYREQLRGWGGRDPRTLAYFLALLESPGDARLWVARLEGAIVGVVLAFVAPEETYAWWSGASPGARAARAYPAMLARMIEDCGSLRVNLGFSGRRSRLTDFKEQIGARPVSIPVLELTPRPRTPWHAMLVRLREQRRRALRPELAEAE